LPDPCRSLSCQFQQVLNIPDTSSDTRQIQFDFSSDRDNREFRQGGKNDFQMGPNRDFRQIPKRSSDSVNERVQIGGNREIRQDKIGSLDRVK